MSTFPFGVDVGAFLAGEEVRQHREREIENEGARWMGVHWPVGLSRTHREQSRRSAPPVKGTPARHIDGAERDRRLHVGVMISAENARPRSSGRDTPPSASPDYSGPYWTGWPFGPFGGGDPTDPTDGPWGRLGCDPSIIGWIAAVDCAGQEQEAASEAEADLESAEFGVDWECTCAFVQVEVEPVDGDACEFSTSCQYFCACEASLMQTQDGRPVA